MTKPVITHTQHLAIKNLIEECGNSKSEAAAAHRRAMNRGGWYTSKHDPVNPVPDLSVLNNIPNEVMARGLTDGWDVQPDNAGDDARQNAAMSIAKNGIYGIMQTSDKQPRWAEISHNHREESDGFLVGYVDAWLTSNEDDDEEGKVIAQVVGAVIDGKPSVFVVHCDPEARFDEMAKEAIAECSADITEELNKTLLSSQAEIRRRLLTEGSTRTFQVLAWIPGQAEGECFAQVTVVSAIFDGKSIQSLPQVEMFIPPGLGEDVTHRVNELVTEFLEEIKAERTE